MSARRSRMSAPGHMALNPLSTSSFPRASVRVVCVCMLRVCARTRVCALACVCVCVRVCRYVGVSACACERARARARVSVLREKCIPSTRLRRAPAEKRRVCVPPGASGGRSENNSRSSCCDITSSAKRIFRPVCVRAHTHTTHTYTHVCKRLQDLCAPRPNKLTHARTHKHAHTRTHTHAHTRTHTVGVDCKISDKEEQVMERNTLELRPV